MMVMGKVARRWMSTDPFVILGVDKTDGVLSIKKRYVELARRVHPDMNPGDESAHDRFVELTAAMERVVAFLNQDRMEKGNEVKGRIHRKGKTPEDIFGVVAKEVKAEMKTVAETMQAGGPDWGGMWQMVEMMKAEEESQKKGVVCNLPTTPSPAINEQPTSKKHSNRDDMSRKDLSDE